MEDAEPQVRDWRFAKLHTTVLREVDVCIPFRLPAFEDDHWKRLVAPPTMRGPIMPAENGTTLLRRTGPLAKGLPNRDIPLSKVLTAFGKRCIAIDTQRARALCSQSDNFLSLRA